MRSRRLLTALAVTAALMGIAVAAGYATSASAQDAATLAGAAPDQPGHPGNPPEPGQPGQPRHPGRPPRIGCMLLANYVRRACPCQGPDGEGWQSHDEFVECVANALDEKLADKDNEKLQECADRILERAENSEIGDPDFECRPRRGPRRGRGGPGHPGHPGKPGKPRPPTPEPPAPGLAF